jgi:hypothetical protein
MTQTPNYSPRANHGLLLADIAAKVLYIGLSLFVALNPTAQQFAGKAMWPRLVAYPVGVFLLPLLWWVLNRNRPHPSTYPYLSDILFTLPFVTDLAGNVFDLFDTIEVYDDVMHFLNWALLSGAFGNLLLRTRIRPLVVAGLTVGFGAAAAILWEGIEWATFIRFGTEWDTAYQDTLLDEHLGLLGSTVAAIVVMAAKHVRSGTTSCDHPN